MRRRGPSANEAGHIASWRGLCERYALPTIAAGCRWPLLKLVLNCPGNGPGGTINHLGVEVSSTGEVTQAGARMAAGLPAEPEPGAVCCYPRQDKVWARDPDGVACEYYTVLEHIDTP